MNSDHAPTAEEQLPPLEDGWTNGDYHEFVVAVGQDDPSDVPYPESVLEYIARRESIIRQRERQLTAALRSNREKDAKIAELEQTRSFRSWLKEHAKVKAAEAKLRAVSDALDEKPDAIYIDTDAIRGADDWFRADPIDAIFARIRAIVEGK